jgi:hypothetical protein
MAIDERMQSEKASGRTSWATSSIGTEPEVTIEALQISFSDKITTPWGSPKGRRGATA